MKQKGKTRKAINFDLDTKKLAEELGNAPKGYYIIRKAMSQLGFDWRQGSGYVSREEIGSKEINKFVNKLYEKIPWIVECAREFDVTDISQRHSLKPQFERSKAQIDAQMRRDPLYKMKIMAQRKNESVRANSEIESFNDVGQSLPRFHTKADEHER